jgi:ssDNA-binding replication factor A large subunit
MKIGEIKRGMSGISVTAKIIDVSDSRDVQTKYGRRSVADATLEDETGQISMSLWENQINSVAVGDTVTVSGAYVTEFRDKLQLSIPRTGKIEVNKE